MEPEVEDYVVAVRGVSHCFGRKAALDDVSLDVRRGQVFGLVGENGAGKTTLLHHLIGAHVPKTGSVRVFGLDPVKHPAPVLERIGYLSEDRDLPLWMRVGELMHYMQAFYPGWDESYAERLRADFGLDARVRVRNLSRGEKARAALLVALAHRPALLLLDEPSSGLDAIARQEILGAVVRTVAEEGRTVIFSSHLLDEVERVADHVAMLHAGRVTLDMPMDALKARHRKYVLRWPEAQATLPILPGVIGATGEGCEWGVICEGEEDLLASVLSATGGEIIESSVPTLETIFLARAAL